jgi:hypothetical protein
MDKNKKTKKILTKKIKWRLSGLNPRVLRKKNHDFDDKTTVHWLFKLVFPEYMVGIWEKSKKFARGWGLGKKEENLIAGCVGATRCGFRGFLKNKRNK